MSCDNIIIIRKDKKLKNIRVVCQGARTSFSFLSKSGSTKLARVFQSIENSWTQDFASALISNLLVRVEKT